MSRLPAFEGKAIQQVALLAGGVVAVWLVVKYVLPKLGGDLTKGLGETAGNALNGANQGLGKNDLTQQQTDFGGDTVDYSGHGVISTLGAEANSLSGGLFASIGEWVGGAFYERNHPYDPNAPTASAVNRNQVVTPNYVTDLYQTTTLGGASGDF